MTAESTDLKAGRILFVDDEVRIISALKRTMKKTAHKCFFTDNASKALGILETEQIDMIVSDVLMPGMSGGQFLSESFAKCPDAIRIILTGYPESPQVITAVREGHVSCFIQKPWEAEELLQTIDNAIFNHKFSLVREK